MRTIRINAELKQNTLSNAKITYCNFALSAYPFEYNWQEPIFHRIVDNIS